MRCSFSLTVCAIYLIAVFLFLPHPAHAGAPGTNATPERGIAVLASSIGSDYSPEGLAEFVLQGKFSPVVIDWAWITAHWDQTDFTALNRFIDLLAARNVPVAAMYRPRFLDHPTVPTQVTQDGKPAAPHGYYICYSSPEARQWGISWGTKLLRQCPRINEIIIYNPQNQCQCPACQKAARGNQYAHYDAVWTFLTEAKAVWQQQRATAKLGVVFVNDPEFWKRGAQVVDAAHPFLFVMDDTDLAKDAKAAAAIRDLLPGKTGHCLAKVTWGPNDKVTPARLAEFDKVAANAGLPYFFWTFDTLFDSSLYDPKAVAQALKLDPAVIATAAGKMHRQQPAGAPLQGIGQPGNLMYSPEQIRSISAEDLLGKMFPPEQGYQQFAAMNALAQKARESDAESRRAIIAKVLAVIKDNTKPYAQRWQCCYVLGDSGDEQVVPDLIQVLERTEMGLSGFAAEALATFVKNNNNTAAHDALVKAASTDASVREVVARRLGEEVPEDKSQPAPIPARVPSTAAAVEERAPNGPPQPPPAPKPPVAKPLPWPFTGDQKEQNLFNNYQQPTDGYIHCGLDLIHPAGTPVTAVDSGYVAAIFTNYPEWVTHYFFIVTPKKGGDEGWCYTHIDPRTFTFKEGDMIWQGQKLGTLVDFSIGKQPGAAHLHLDYVKFARDAQGKVYTHSMLDPLYFFDWKDSEPPVFQPLRFVPSGGTKLFQSDAEGVVTVSGKVDILAAIADSAYPGHMGNLGVPVVMLSISDGTHTMQKLVVDHRGDVGDEKQVKPLYLSWDERKTFYDPSGFPRYHMLRVTKTDGDGLITPRDAVECWDTTARDRAGQPLWPDGKYSVNVYAWDIAGNQGVVGAIVQVKNTPGQQ